MAKVSKSPNRQGREPVRRTVFWIILAVALGAVGGYQWTVSHNAGRHAEEIRDFIGTYFKTWSSKDMAGYADCFDSTAMIYFIQDRRVVLRQDKPDFIAGQTAAVRNGPEAMEEHAESLDIMTEGDTAYVRAHWKMTKENVIKYGHDHFVLLRKSQGWRIIALSFYETKD